MATHFNFLPNRSGPRTKISKSGSRTAVMIQPWIPDDWSANSGQHKLLGLHSDAHNLHGIAVAPGSITEKQWANASWEPFMSLAPPLFLLISAPFMMFRLYHTKLVAAPNSRGVIKAVSLVPNHPFSAITEYL